MRAPLAWGTWAVTVLLAVAALGVRLANTPLFAEGIADPAAILSEILYGDILVPAAVPALATLGAILAAHRPVPLGPPPGPVGGRPPLQPPPRGRGSSSSVSARPLRDEVDIDALRAELLATTGKAVQPAGACGCANRHGTRNALGTRRA